MLRQALARVPVHQPGVAVLGPPARPPVRRPSGGYRCDGPEPSELFEEADDHQPWSTSRRAKEKRAEVGAAWWLEWSPSPHVSKANHWLLVEIPGYLALPKRCPMALIAELRRR